MELPACCTTTAVRRDTVSHFTAACLEEASVQLGVLHVMRQWMSQVESTCVAGMQVRCLFVVRGFAKPVHRMTREATWLQGRALCDWLH